ncbi:MAG: hypothetical protein ACI9GO_000152 [Bacteroidia bacterium]|jgi:hypothetical protein
MQKGICHVAQIPLRGEPQSSAEMVSQLLFGETYSVLSQKENWYHIIMDFDGYTGWLSKSSFHEYILNDRYVQRDLFASEQNDITSGTVLSSMGSEIIGSSASEEDVFIQDLAKKFLGAPYLWGGRHFSGIDCSGLVQVIYKVLAIHLPRDASQQQKVGKPVSFEDLFVGDLVFFENNEQVGHVGMVIGQGKVIHAHGMVRIDTLTKAGIINMETKEMTHFYHSAKRLR